MGSTDITPGAPKAATGRGFRGDLETFMRDAEVSEEDRVQVREFAAFLRMAGPPGKPWSKAKMARIRKRFGDRWLGFQP